MVFIFSSATSEIRQLGTWTFKDNLLTMTIKGVTVSTNSFKYDESLDTLKCHMDVEGTRAEFVLERAIEGTVTEAFRNIAVPDITPTNQQIVLAAKENISSLSDDEISIFARYINQEIANRKTEKTAHLDAGWYAIGSDIPAGKYIYQIEEGQYLGSYAIAKNYNLGNMDESDLIDYAQYITSERTYLLDLQNGQFFYSTVPFQLTIKAQKVS